MSLFFISKSSANNLFRPAGHRMMMMMMKMSTGVPVQEASSASSTGGATALLAAVGTTFVTYMTADFLSNFLQHPTQKMDYGYFNQFIGRPVDQAWWGTRTQHIVGVAAALAVTDHASQSIFTRYLGSPLSFAKHPAAFVAHTFFFIFSGVTLYVAADAAFNPLLGDNKQDRIKALKEGTYSSAIGSCTAWYEPYVAPTLAKVAGPAVANTWLGSSLLPATLAYSTVKGVGWYDWGNSGLNDHEMRLNGLAPPSAKQ